MPCIIGLVPLKNRLHALESDLVHRELSRIKRGEVVASHFILLQFCLLVAIVCVRFGLAAMSLSLLSRVYAADHDFLDLLLRRGYLAYLVW